MDQLEAVWQWAKRYSPLPVSSLLLLARRVADRGGWNSSVEVLRRAVREAPNDYEAYRQLGWHLSKIGEGHEERGA